MELRLRRLEEKLERYAEALEFLGKVYEQQKATQRQRDDELDPDAMFAVEIAADVKLGKVAGPATAAVTIVKAFDFACPYCERTSSVMEELVTEYAGKVRVIYKDLVVHPEVATTAHLAACAAAKQGKYLPFKTAIWEKGFRAYVDTREVGKLGEANLLSIAKAMKLDVKKLEADMKGDACKTILVDDTAELAKFKVNATPTFFINGKPISGALPKEGFKALIDEQLAVVTASGVAAADYYDKVVMVKGEKTFKPARTGR
ncbi:MAG: oxidoreductase [Myxococcales bacterium]|nr:oxidoreductase [Myxococcales bacterium]